jgi:ubiquinone/menaquinone biosynthesis C-methylase UbiE
MKTSPNQENGTNDALNVGAAIYSKPVLSVYDLYVLGFSNTFVWRCASHLILDFYNEHISVNHLDVGVGTGYFLDKCKFPTHHAMIALADLNTNSLQATKKRLQRYNPTVHIANVLDPLRIEPADFDSIALNYLLHCLPGNLLDKGSVFRNLRPLLNHNGVVVFRTTILGRSVKQNLLAKALMQVYNSKGIFCNIDDHAAD